MATYKPRIDQYTAAATPSGWTSEWDSETSFTAETSDTVWGKDLQLDAAFASRTALTYDAAGSGTDQEVLAQVVRDTTAANLRCRVSGTGSAETGYFLRLNQNDWQIQKYTAGTPGTFGSTASYPTTQTHIKARFRVETDGSDATVLAKIWGFDEVEPTAWTNSFTDASTSITSGTMGIGTITGNVTYEAVTFADGGDTAPDFSVLVAKEADAVVSGGTAEFGVYPTSPAASLTYDFREVGGSTLQSGVENFYTATVTSSTDYEVLVSDTNGVYALMPLGNVTTTTDTVAIEPLDGEFANSLTVTNPTASNPAISWASTSPLNSYIRLDNVDTKTPTFEVTNFTVEPNVSVTADWWQGAPYFSYTPEDDTSWVQFTPANCTVTTGTSTVTFYHGSAFAADTVYVSMCPSAKQKSTRAWVEDILTDSLVSVTSSGDSNGVYAVSDPRSGTSTRVAIPRNKYAFKFGTGSLNFVLVTGQHASEDAGELVFRRFVESLLTASSNAVSLRNIFTFYCYPGLNTSRDIGSSRSEYDTLGTADQTDPNRDWGTFDTDSASKAHTAIEADTGGVVDCVYDFHGAAAAIAPFGYCMSVANGGVTANDDFITRYTSYSNYNSDAYTLNVADQTGDGRVNEYYQSVHSPTVQLAATIESQHFFNSVYTTEIADHVTNLVEATLNTYNDGNITAPSSYVELANAVAAAATAGVGLTNYLGLVCADSASATFINDLITLGYVDLATSLVSNASLINSNSVLKRLINNYSSTVTFSNLLTLDEQAILELSSALSGSSTYANGMSTILSLGYSTLSLSNMYSKLRGTVSIKFFTPTTDNYIVIN